MGQTLPLTHDLSICPKPSFFSRQFASQGTKRQLGFDVVFGIVSPIVCFIADPIVFTGIMGGIFSPFQFYVYTTSAISIVALVVWLCLREHLGSYGPVLGGVFTAGAALSGVIGVIILPFSLAGIFLYFVGLAGFTPFLTAFVYLRNALRAFAATEGSRSRELKRVVTIVAAVATFGLPAVLNHQVTATVTTSVDQLIHGDANEARQAAERLQWIPILPQASLDPVVRAYASESDAQKKAVLKKYYQDATGGDIERRLMILND